MEVAVQVDRQAAAAEQEEEVKKFDASLFVPAFKPRKDDEVAAYDRQLELESRTRRFLACGINEREKKCSFGSFVRDTPERRVAFGLMKSYCEKLEKGAAGNLVLYGGCGCGKTHLSVSVLRELLFATKGEAYGFPVYFSGSYVNFTDLTDFKDRMQLYQRIDAMAKKDLCVVDEICEFSGTRISAQEILYKIADRVYEHGTSCILITNMDIDSFMGMLTAACKSRLNSGGSCSLVDITELGDFRQKNKGGGL